MKDHAEAFQYCQVLYVVRPSTFLSDGFDNKLDLGLLWSEKDKSLMAEAAAKLEEELP